MPAACAATVSVCDVEGVIVTPVGTVPIVIAMGLEIVVPDLTTNVTAVVPPVVLQGSVIGPAGTVVNAACNPFTESADINKSSQTRDEGIAADPAL